jgi:hypothetical protein
MSAGSSAHPLWQNKCIKVLYRALCDHEGKADVRVYFEDLYEKAAPAGLLHKDFVSKFPNEVPQLWWEMFFANWLMQQSLLAGITTPKSGPDFLATLGEQKIWIECTAPWPKNHARRIDSTQLSGVGTINPDDYLLAITAAMREKIGQLSSLAVAPADIRLVAINLGTGADVHLVVWDDPPLLFQALLGVGPMALQIPVSNGEADTSEIRAVPTFKETVNSAKGSPIGLRGFLDGSLSAVSGAFFSSHRYMDCPKAEESQFDFLHNPTAAVSCPRKLFRNVREYEVADGFVKEVS